MMQSNRLFFWIMASLGGMVLLFIVAPLFNILLSSSPQTLLDTARDEEVSSSIGRSLLLAMLATLLFSVFAVPFAWLLARYNFPMKRVISGLIDVPVMIPHSAAGIAVLGVLNRDSLFGKLAANVGIDFVDRPAGIIIAMAFVSLPFLINGARDAFMAVPEKLEKAALNLGASHSRMFVTISLPLAWRGILSGFVMMFARGMSEFGAVVIIAYNPFTAPVLIFDRFNAFGLSEAQPVSVLFILISLVVFIGLRMLTKNNDHARS
jgi:molybdate/tungstate transport system permease protein